MVRDGRRRSWLGCGPRSRTDLIMVHVWSADTGPTAQPPGQTTPAGLRAVVLAVRTRSEQQRSAERDHVHLVQRWLPGPAATFALPGPPPLPAYRLHTPPPPIDDPPP